MKIFTLISLILLITFVLKSSLPHRGKRLKFSLDLELLSLCVSPVLINFQHHSYEQQINMSELTGTQQISRSQDSS